MLSSAPCKSQSLPAADMRRRDFITLLGGIAVEWPLRASAQQSATPVVGFVSSASASPSGAANLVGPFLQGLNEGGTSTAETSPLSTVGQGAEPTSYQTCSPL